MIKQFILVVNVNEHLEGKKKVEFVSLDEIIDGNESKKNYPLIPRNTLESIQDTSKEGIGKQWAVKMTEKKIAEKKIGGKKTRKNHRKKPLKLR